MLIRHDARSFFDVATYHFLHGLLAAIRDDASAYASLSYKHSHNDCLGSAYRTSFLALHDAFPAILVHVPGLAADVGFVNFDFAVEHAASKIVLHCKANPVKHEPRRLLSDLQGACDLTAAHAILAIQDQPHCDQPLIKADSRVLKDRTDLNRELPLRMPS